MFRYSLLVFFWLLVVAAGAQPITGRVTDARTGQPLPFVNIGVVGKALGTVSNEQGQYGLAFQESLANDTVRVSYLGYQPRLLTLRQLRAQPAVALTAAAVALAEVRVAGTNTLRRTRTLGFDGDSETTTLTVSNAKDLGAEIGTIIHLKHAPSRVLNVKFNVAYNHGSDFAFRVNIYRLRANGKPSDDKLLRREVVVRTTPATSKGPIIIDLTSDKLLLDDDFFLAVEWVAGSSAVTPHKDFAFSAGLGYANNDIYYRAVSQDAWERLSAGAVLAGMQPKVSFYATVQD
ncbi:hypothetical protein GCM10027422_45030 [Hymenobacter arcticus]